MKQYIKPITDSHWILLLNRIVTVAILAVMTNKLKLVGNKMLLMNCNKPTS